MQRKPEDLTLADLPGADATRFEEWRRLHRRARMAPLLGLIIWASALITVPRIGGTLGWLLPIILWFTYMIAYAIPLASRERKLAAALGVPPALGLTPDQIMRTERRIKVARMAGLGLLVLVAAWAGLVVLSIRIDRAGSDAQATSAKSAAQQLAESYTVRFRDNPESFNGAKVRPLFFETADVKPMAGVFFGENAHEANAPNVVVLSYDIWQRLFNGDLGMLGQSIELNGREATVTAIAPQGFKVPGQTDFWTPAKGLE